MSDSLPSVTVIIPTRPDGGEPKAVAAARALDYPSDKLEIIVARGRQPSVQRNAALRAAHGELVYFLDDDSVAAPGNLRRAVEHFRDPNVQIVGGPNLCPADAPVLEQVLALVLASWLAFGPSRARYTPVGKLRQTGEKELILCNQLARRATVLKHGGFNEALYPNEENALMDDIQKADGKLLYDPELVVYRRPRRTIKSFAKMLLTYGRGRAEQFRVNPTFGSALNFAPPLFLIYLLTLPILWSITFHPDSEWLLKAYEVPLLLYLVAVILQIMVLMARGGVAHSLCALPLMVMAHLLYGAGFWRGLFTTLNRTQANSPTAVTLETITR
ncbi:MAG: glycosyltransferase [Verrucomicrobia bacterium]|nr:glycosyltransferase [Verrucomicrobiota bacterium]